MRKVLILDTSILCVWLNVPGKTACGSDNDRWDQARVTEKIKEEEQADTTFVLPLAALIETGNHIAQAGHSRRERAIALADVIRKSADDIDPWAAFDNQAVLWTPEYLRELADTWPELAMANIAIGDATIKALAEYYAKQFKVEILTGDQGLKAYEPTAPVEQPRRRRR
uniref:PIN domain-containing protein n=1 Tax=uncultured Thiotrichaceae bacterium TaxID=298394 RepID=A0A6S6TD56_9GAMM|nr:MAG: Unknown protein [uncultured Thiotrichaceae bacterium]